MATEREPTPRRAQRRPIIERIASWSAHHRAVVIFGWLALVIVLVFGGQAVGTRQLGSQATPGEAGRAERMLSRAGVSDPISESVLIQDAGGGRTVDDPALQGAIQDVVATLGRFPGTAAQIRSPLQAANAGQVSRDRRSALVTFVVDRTDVRVAEQAVAPVEAAVKQVQARHPGLRIEQAGQASVSRALDDTLGKDFHRAELSAVPVTLAILLVAFGALLAAGIPVLLAVSAVMAALGLLAISSHWAPVTDSAATMILLIGLAVGVDYSLFYLRREREERASGHDTTGAIRIAAATSGRAVVVSGLTVLISMAGLLFTGLADVNGIAIGTMLVVAVAVAGSVTVLPAVLGWLGRWVDRGRVPLVGRRRTRPGDSRPWGAIVRQVLRHPLVWGGVAALLLVGLAIPATGLRLVQPSLQQEVPGGLPTLRTLERIQTAFPGGPEPAQIVIAGHALDRPELSRAIGELRRRAVATGQLREPISVTLNQDNTLAVVQVPLAGNGTDAASERALARLRNDVIPATIGAVPGVRLATTGLTASNHDYNQVLVRRAPLVVGFVLVLAFGLLLVSFRSLAIPLTAIGLNLLSVGAAYGLLKLIFQDGRLEGLLGFRAYGGIVPWLPLFLFVVLFGLSADYHVFILSRIREAHDRGASTQTAIEHGIRRSAGVVTSAAVVMVAVFAIFATLSDVTLKMVGVGLAAAILLDATVVRGVLVPAVMGLLGERNWYLPRWLAWLPAVNLEGPASTPAAGRPQRVGS
jgi:putative drug exporter of the RND superfamily